MYLDTVPNKCYCGNLTKFWTFTRGYKEYCSTKCLNNSTKVQTNKKRTMLSKYGVEHALQNEDIKKLRDNTTKERYGNKNYKQ